MYQLTSHRNCNCECTCRCRSGNDGSNSSITCTAVTSIVVVSAPILLHCIAGVCQHSLNPLPLLLSSPLSTSCPSYFPRFVLLLVFLPIPSVVLRCRRHCGCRRLCCHCHFKCCIRSPRHHCRRSVPIALPVFVMALLMQQVAVPSGQPCRERCLGVRTFSRSKLVRKLQGCQKWSGSSIAHSLGLPACPCLHVACRLFHRWAKFWQDAAGVAYRRPNSAESGMAYACYRCAT